MAIERAVLAGGCFWGMQDLIRKLPGVTETSAGYTGGEIENATYRNHGDHAEAIEIYFENTVIEYRKILEFFFQILQQKIDKVMTKGVNTAQPFIIQVLNKKLWLRKPLQMLMLQVFGQIRW